MEFLHSFLRRHLAGKPVVASPNVGCFLRLVFLTGYNNEKSFVRTYNEAGYVYKA